ncbi:hypothetical protein Bsp3421_000839 [Burkholderia sp. FERM BP-3421]|jgi:hypothetical protein|uniref:hypothetical protein n=1 Tax=Burkholderia sp. FERM BP-3421 TaxID=1494466 RepID=UPI00235F6272|nr:hypothetical protein [Burkholderia sp. FERM BP-3421]WDD90951.1 hypothetical protein Bsp3421_000839 [Burkholderia sp. FERM BP-3421]
MQANLGYGIDSDDREDEVAERRLDTTIHFDAASRRITFHIAWAIAVDGVRDTARHSVELSVDCGTVERFGHLDAAARARVRAMLSATIWEMLDALPAHGEARTLRVELSRATLDAACRLQ